MQPSLSDVSHSTIGNLVPPSHPAMEAITSEQRRVLGTIADLLIPEGAGMPRASAAGVAVDGVDRVLRSRPDLGPDLREALASVSGLPVDQMLSRLREADQASRYSVISEVVVGAYFLNPAVLGRLGYPGQTGAPIHHPSLDAGDEELLRSVVARGSIFREC